MGRFGEELRKEREARGIALEEITAATKVSSRHLAALEQEQFKLLPGGVFNKGIVRSYARVVGLDQDDWVNRYLSAYKQSGGVVENDTDWIEFANNVHRARVASRRGRGEMLRWVGVFLLLIVLVVVAYFVFEYVRRREASLSNPPSQIHARLSSTSPGDSQRAVNSSNVQSQIKSLQVQRRSGRASMYDLRIRY